jgi:hypothetical protein
MLRHATTSSDKLRHSSDIAPTNSDRPDNRSYDKTPTKLRHRHCFDLQHTAAPDTLSKEASRLVSRSLLIVIVVVRGASSHRCRCNLALQVLPGAVQNSVMMEFRRQRFRHPYYLVLAVPAGCVVVVVVLEAGEVFVPVSQLVAFALVVVRVGHAAHFFPISSNFCFFFWPQLRGVNTLVRTRLPKPREEMIRVWPWPDPSSILTSAIVCHPLAPTGNGTPCPACLRESTIDQYILD